MLLSKVPSEFKARRDALMAQATKGGHPSAFIFPSAQEVLRNPDVHFGFRQESNFYYLSGFDEPESVLVIAPRASGAPGAPVTARSSAYRMILFVRHRDVEKEMWEGERYGVDRAVSVFGADEAYTIDEFERRLPDLLKGAEQVHYRLGDPHWDPVVLRGMEQWRRSHGRSGKSLPPLLDPNALVGELRMFKSPAEVALMRKAGEASALAHLAAMKEVRPGMNEFEIEALVDYVFRKNGCQRVGYGSIVAGGKNAACLHYRANNEPLKDGDLLLIDAAGEYNYYTADITRAFPVGRGFTDAQARVYDLVLKSQLEGIAMTKPGVTLPAIHRRVCEVLADGLLSLGLLKGKADEVISNGALRRFYPHNTSHWLGMDVHDAGLYMVDGEPRKLEAGMAFTIEPGFYVQPSDSQAPAEYHGIGIRIEDDIIVTEKGCEALTLGAPKTRSAIEALK